MRLDSFLVENGYFSSRSKAKTAIELSEVLVDGSPSKPSAELKGNEKITVVDKKRYVSNGGYKLEKALDDFNISVQGLTFCDIGASTGGFTDCLVSRSAKLVYAVDVGEGLLDESLCNKENIVKIENCNARFITVQTLGERVDAITVDCSFISLKLLLEAISVLLKDSGFIIALIKPQFECGRKALPKSGILTDKNARLKACEDVFDFAKGLGFTVSGITNSPIRDKKNVEYLILLTRGGVEIDRAALKKLDGIR